MKTLKVSILALALLGCTSLSARTFYVSPSGSDQASATVDAPFKTISQAARMAVAGDTVLIQNGVYRERVSPAHAGLNEREMVSYIAENHGEVSIKGSEIVTGWEKISKDGIYRVKVSNDLFGDFNPYTINLSGDWLHNGAQFHLGALYIDDFALAEKQSLEEVRATPQSWIVSVDEEYTTIEANFGGADPNKSLTEINVRSSCFAPRTTGINYIRVQGIKLSQAATQWAPPTAEQEGLITPNWSKGWVIEDCEISHSKCVGISLGKDRASGQNRTTLYADKPGYIMCGFNREIEAIIAAEYTGWSKENIGSHKILNNKIHKCGQAGIVGHLGSIFSIIKGNEIRDVNYIVGMRGFEIAGIKLHAAIDVEIDGNLIENSYMGLWLDWQAQGTQVKNNIFANNKEQDLFIEVSHGPTMVYNNIMLSDRSMHIDAQGVAFFNNLVSGRIKVRTSSFRYTPYHVAHSTRLRGLFNNTGGDVRYYNNIFLANGEQTVGLDGLEGYDEYPVYSDDLGKDLKGTDKFLLFKFPIWTGGNVYFSENSKPYVNEVDFKRFEGVTGSVKLERRDDKYFLDWGIDSASLNQVETRAINTEMLGRTTIAELWFDNPDGSSFTLESDIYGRARDTVNPAVGPIEGGAESPIWQF